MGKTLKVETPKMQDVIYSLVADSTAIDHGSFESWCDDYGYDTDSRKAESIYRACVKIGLKMRLMFGESGLASLHTLFQDY